MVLKLSFPILVVVALTSGFPSAHAAPPPLDLPGAVVDAAIRPAKWGEPVPPLVGMRPTRLPSSVQERGSTSYRPGTFDVHILVVPTDEGPAPWDRGLAERYVTGLDAWYAAATDGRYRFRLAKFHTLPAYKGYLCGVHGAFDHAKDALKAIKPGRGATDALPVIVNLAPDFPGPGCDMDGQAFQGSPGAWMRAFPEYKANDATTFAHEIGHNFGLAHSSAPEPDSGDEWLEGKVDPYVWEYADSGDVMGVGGHWQCDERGWRCTFMIGGLHGHNRNLLGVLKPRVISHVPMPSRVEESVDIELVAAQSGESGKQVAYLPWRQMSKFMIEYRPAAGLDQYVGESHGTGAGVHVRMIGDRFDDYVAYPGLWNPIGTVAVAAGAPRGFPVFTYPTVPTAFGVGQSTRLPDGTRITVLSMTPTRAIVRVARPADTDAPVMQKPLIESAAGVCKKFPCRIPQNASQDGVYPVWISTGRFLDEQWVSSASITINGKPFVTVKRAMPDGTDEESPLQRYEEGWGRIAPLKAGSHTVRYTYRDLSGNVGSSSYRLNVG